MLQWFPLIDLDAPAVNLIILKNWTDSGFELPLRWNLGAARLNVLTVHSPCLIFLTPGDSRRQCQ